MTAARAARAPPPEFLDAGVEVERLVSDAALCDKVTARLERKDVDESEVAATLAWILPDAVELATATKWSSRVVQKLLDVADASGCDVLAAALVQRSIELVESENGNHAIVKAIEVAPCEGLRPVIEQIEAYGYLRVAKHRYGCRVVERLMEYCTEREIGSLNALLVESSADLCRHEFGNFDIQALLEHYPSCRGGIVSRMLGGLPHLAKHRTASHVVQKAIQYGSPDQRRAMVSTLLEAETPNSIEEVAASRYGAFVVEELLSPLCLGASDLVCEVQRRLAAAAPEHRDSAYFNRVAQAFGLQAELPAPSQEPAMVAAC